MRVEQQTEEEEVSLALERPGLWARQGLPKRALFQRLRQRREFLRREQLDQLRLLLRRGGSEQVEQ